MRVLNRYASLRFRDCIDKMPLRLIGIIAKTLPDCPTGTSPPRQKLYRMELFTNFPGLCLFGCAFFPAKITQKSILQMSILDESQDRLSLWRDEEGTTAVEYAVMLALIVAVCIGSVATLTDETKRSFEKSGDAIAGAMGN